MIVHIQQPGDSRICGQCCVAMLAGVKLSEVIAMIGAGLTSTDKIVDALHGFGLEAELERVKTPLINVEKATAILYINWRNKEKRTMSGHWVLLVNGTVHDPTYHGPMLFSVWHKTIISRCGWCTSAVLITSTELESFDESNTA